MKGNINKDELYFTINEVARQIGVTPATIRNWDRRGLFVARRSDSGYRIYDLSDIEALRSIRKYSKDDRMGAKAIRMLYSRAPGSPPDREDGEALVSKKLMGEKWKRCRTERGYPLEDVARAIGISASYLSKIENVQVNVSLVILQKLAAFYGEDVMYYVKDAEEETNVVRRGRGESFTIGIEGLRIESVLALKRHVLSPMIYTVEPGCGRTAPLTHSGEEFLHVLSGRLHITLEDQSYILRKGDSMGYRCSSSHCWYNCGKVTARILWIYTPVVRE